MFRQYRCSYWTQDGRLIRTVVTAESILSAQAHVESMPDFRNFCGYPQLADF